MTIGGRAGLTEVVSPNTADVGPRAGEHQQP